MSRNYSNIALDTTLVAGIAAGDLSCVVASASGWPAASFAATIDPGLVTEEVVQVTVKVGTTFTITRGFDGTTAAIHVLGAVVRHAAIAGDFTDLQTADSTEAGTRAAADTANAGNLSTHAALTTTAHGGIVASTDARLTDARTPTAHAATHASIGSDPVTLAQSQITGLAPALALLAPLASPTLTGTPAAPTAAPGTNTTQLATTAFVLANAGGGSVTDVTASAPLASSGGATPDISLTGIVASTLGGTGVNNAGTLTNASNTDITGGGTLALGGFTLTVPATGTSALLATSNLFSVRQDIRASGAAIAAGLYVPWITGDTLPTLKVGSSTAGNTQQAIQALSDSGVSVYGISGSGAGVRGDSTSSYGVQAVTVSGNAIFAQSSTGRCVQALQSASTGTADTSEIFAFFRRSTGTPTAGFGERLAWYLKSSTTNDQLAGAIDAQWTDATHATRTAEQRTYLAKSGTLTEAQRTDFGSGAGTTGFLLWDVDNNTLERVTVGIADSGGAGFKLLRIAN